MVNLLDSIHEYQLLVCKQRALGVPLDDEERARFEGLRRLLRGDYLGTQGVHAGARRRPMPVQLTVPAGFGAGEVRSLSGSGMAVVTDGPVPLGARTILRVADPVGGHEYVFPGRVVWRSGRVLGVAFDGLPSKSASPGRSDSWRPGRLRFGRRRVPPLVA